MLSRAMLTIIGAHACRCEVCKPEYKQSLDQAAKNMAVNLHVESLEEEVVASTRENLIIKH